MEPGKRLGDFFQTWQGGVRQCGGRVCRTPSEGDETSKVREVIPALECVQLSAGCRSIRASKDASSGGSSSPASASAGAWVFKLSRTSTGR